MDSARRNGSSRCQTSQSARSELTKSRSSNALRRAITPLTGASRNRGVPTMKNDTTFKTFLQVSQLDARLNVDLYKCPGSGRVKRRSPEYRFPRGKSKSFHDQVQKLAKKSPSPGDHHTDLKWAKRQAVNQAKGSDRIMEIDKIMKRSRKMPSPNTYRVEIKDRAKLGKLDKTQGISFMSESEYLGKVFPAPNKYEINESLVKKKTIGFSIIKPKTTGLKWRPVKVNGPDPGTYKFEVV